MNPSMKLRRALVAAAAVLPLAFGAAPVRAGLSPTEDFFHDIEVDYARGVEQKIRQGFDPNTRDAKGQVPLFVALRGGSLKAAKALWEAPATQVDARNSADETPLMIAAMKGEQEAAAALLARGASARKDGWSPLHYAATGGDAAIIKMLLAKGAVLDARSPNETTPLMMAARYGSEEAVDALLAAGADRGLKNDQGLDAAAFATGAGRDKLAARLKAPPAP